MNIILWLLTGLLANVILTLYFKSKIDKLIYLFSKKLDVPYTKEDRFTFKDVKEMCLVRALLLVYLVIFVMPVFCLAGFMGINDAYNDALDEEGLHDYL